MRLVDYDIVFLSVQKTGSTAARQFFEANYKVDKFDHNHYTRAQILDKGLAKPTDTFIGVVREPLERQLSRFLYQAKLGIFEYSPYCFRKIIVDGNGCLPNYKRAVDYDADVWWPYPHLHSCMQHADFTVRFIDLPRVNMTGNLPTDQWMVSQFYDDHARELATEYHKADTELLTKIL